MTYDKQAAVENHLGGWVERESAILEARDATRRADALVRWVRSGQPQDFDQIYAALQAFGAEYEVWKEAQSRWEAIPRS